MAQKILILGDSGTGKSASMRNFKPEEVLVINAAGKPLPFKNHFETVSPAFETLTADIMKALTSTNKKVIVIDDVQYILSFPMMRRIKESGWDKWNDIQGDFFNIIQACDGLPDDVIVYFLSHLQRTDDGHEKIKTVGKMLDEKITIEGLFTVVLKTIVTDGKYYFQTQNGGMDTVKSPIGMFETFAIDNDLKYVDTKIRNYYEIGDYVPDEEMKQMDREVAKPEVNKEDAGVKRHRRRSVVPSADTVDADKPTSTDSDAATIETAVNQPEPEQKQRRRKERNVETQEEKPEDTPAEEKKAKAADETEAAAPRRRRRAHQPAESTISDEDLPF